MPKRELEAVMGGVTMQLEAGKVMITANPGRGGYYAVVAEIRENMNGCQKEKYATMSK